MGVIEITVPVAVTLMLAFLGCVAAFGRVLMDQFEKRMGERHKALEQAQCEDRARLTVLTDEVRDLSRSLPLEYVRREDWIRFSASIDHKLDRLAELVMDVKTGGNRARD